MRSIFILVTLAISFCILTACSSPQVTATSAQPVTVTLPPPTLTPTATLEPTATLKPTATPTEVPVKYDSQTLEGMTPEDIMASVPEMPGYDKQYLGYYVHYVNTKGELGGSYNLETGKKIAMPESLRTLDELPTKIENADSYPEVDVKDLDAFVAWMHFKYDAKAKDLKPYPFVPNESSPLEMEMFGSQSFFKKVDNMRRYFNPLGMAKLSSDGQAVFWSYPRIIKDSSGILRVQLAVDGWDDRMGDLEQIPINSVYYRMTENSAYDVYQIGMFGPNKKLACYMYNLDWAGKAEVTKGCETYLEKYYQTVATEVRRLIETSEYTSLLEHTPMIYIGDRADAINVPG
jgi:hypothetical protein